MSFGDFIGLTNLKQLHLHNNPGAPFTFELQLERATSTTLQAVRVRLPQGAPLPLTVLLPVEPASGAKLSSTQVTIPTGATTSEPVTVSINAEAASGLMISMTLGELPEDTSDAAGSYTGFDINDDQTITLITALRLKIRVLLEGALQQGSCRKT